MRNQEGYLTDSAVKPSLKEQIIAKIEDYFNQANKIRNKALENYQKYDIKLAKCQANILELA